MNFSIKILFISVFLFLTSFSFNLTNIKKGYKALKVYNYFEAKKIFTKGLSKDSSSCSFGLATIYYRHDNPFHSIDSAFRYIQIAERSFKVSDKKLRDRLSPLGFELVEVIRLRDSITTFYYNKAVEINSVLAYDYFLGLHPWAKEHSRALYKRDVLIYEQLKLRNESTLYAEFIQRNPESHFVRLMQADYELALYKEKTEMGDLEDYLLFISMYPTNRYVKDAEDKIYELATVTNDVVSYDLFIQDYPTNRNVDDSWRKLYQLYMIDYTNDRAIQFKTDFPNYPFKFELEQDIKYAKRELLPLKDGKYFGGSDYEGNMILPSTYDYLGFFKEGLAVAVVNGRYGFIDKGNNVVIDFKYDNVYDFEDGRAIVELNELMGVIDRTGKAIISIDFKDIGIFSNGLIYALKDSLYGYYDKSGAIRIDERYEEAFSFNNGVAKVQVEGKQAYIDVLGNYIVKPLYQEVRFFSDSLIVFLENEKYGIASLEGVPIDSLRYETIGMLSEGLALVIMDRKIGYINECGTLVVPIQFEEFPNYMEKAEFKSSMAVASKGEKFGLIDKQGKNILPFKYLQIGKIAPLTAFNKGKGWSFFDLSYEVKIKSAYDFAESFEEGYAIIQKENRWGVIDTAGREIIKPLFQEVLKFDSIGYLVKDSIYFGVYNFQGEVIIPFNYDQIRRVADDFLLLSKENEISYFQLSKQVFIQNRKKEDE